jgi:hypothetical protein
MVQCQMKQIQISGAHYCYSKFLSSSFGVILFVYHSLLRFRWIKTCYRFIPFSGGPRKCVGDQFALLEATVALAVFLQHMNFELVPDQNISMTTGATIHTTNVRLFNCVFCDICFLQVASLVSVIHLRQFFKTLFAVVFCVLCFKIFIYQIYFQSSWVLNFSFDFVFAGLVHET